jgi:hypothetical protein
MPNLFARAVHSDESVGEWHDMGIDMARTTGGEGYRAKEFLEELGEQDVAGVVVGEPGCAMCERQRLAFAPIHTGHSACTNARSAGMPRSNYAIAAGGESAHCTCRGCL